MQEASKFPLDISSIVTEVELKKLVFPLTPGARIFLFGDLGSGKTTFIRHLLREHVKDESLGVRSPTYTYFQKYGENIYHFDLYRLHSLEDFFLIGGDDILNDPESICLIEWPEVLQTEFVPTQSIFFEKISDETRKITFHSSHPSTE